MKKMYLIVLLFFTYYVLILSNQVSYSQSQFQVVIGDSSNIGEARSIILTTDGGYLVVGENDTFGDMYIVKLNSSGQIQWSKTIGGNLQDILLSVAQSADGGYILSGYSNSFQYFSTILIKITSEGNIEWTRFLNTGDPAWSVVQTSDGGYAAAISPTEGGFAPNRMIIVKLNSMGILQWSKRLSGNSYARCIRQTTDKGYIVAGVTDSLDQDMFIVKIDSNGSLQWAKSIGGESDDFAYSIVQTTDGGYAVAGRTSSFPNGDKMYIVKLNNNGILQWTKVVSVFLDVAFSIVQTTDGGYAVAGFTGAHGSMLILKLNMNGSLQWSRVVDGGPEETYARAIIQTTDGGYVAAGYGGTMGTLGMYIVKLDNNGNTCGNTISHNISVDTGGSLVSKVPILSNISISDTTTELPTSTLNNITPICVIGILPISNQIPASYKLYQNYPNPFNPVTMIKFDIPGIMFSSECSVRIYDMLGKEIAVLVNQSLQPGIYQVEFDGSNYASGVYYYQLNILNTGSSVFYHETKRMVLIK